MRIHGLELAQLAAPGQIHRKRKIRQAAPLRAGLKHPRGAAEGVGQGQALDDVLGAGLFAIDILAVVGRQNGRGGVPVRAGRDQDGVDVVPRQEFAQVNVGGAIGVAVAGIRPAFDRRAAIPAHLANRGKAHVRFAEETPEHVSAAAADADGAESDPFTGRHPAVAPDHGAFDDLRHSAEHEAGLNCGTEETPSILGPRNGARARTTRRARRHGFSVCLHDAIVDG